MGKHYLHRLFCPAAVAVIGASGKPESLGARILGNLLSGGFEGDIYPVNPGYEKISGRRCFASVADIDASVDLAVVVTPAATIPDIIRQCGDAGIPGAVVISAGFREIGPEGERLERRMMEMSRRHRVRIVGPNCLGIMRPPLGLNATFSHTSALSGDMAFVSQSGALLTSILDWSLKNSIGFSTMISMGTSADVDFGEVLDYLSVDNATKSILLYVEGIGNARHFMSGIRAAARMKPVVVVKAGRYTAGSKAAVSHTGALVGADDVFDAALRRAGVVRVLTVTELFSAARVLSSGVKVEGNRLAIVTNAGGAGVLAADRAVERGVMLPQLAPETISRLNEVLPGNWSHGNPVDILGDAPPHRYSEALSICHADPGVDGVMAVYVPQAMSDSTKSAKEVIGAAKSSARPTLACWLGGKQVEEGRQLFSENRIPVFTTPEASVDAFSYLARFRRNQGLLMQVPGPLPARAEPDVEGARLIMEGALAEGRTVLSTSESRAVLNAFHIPTARTVEVTSANEALVAAESIGFPVVMKVNSHDITHKSDVGGVRLNINSAAVARSSFKEIVDAVSAHRPDAHIRGVTVEQMWKRPFGRELMVGVVRDPVFGPVISFGAGGTFVEVMQDRAVALPPLNQFLITDMIERTRVAKMLGKFRQMPPVDVDALAAVLLSVSAMVCELPHVEELDINPLIADESGTMAVDARIVVRHPAPNSDRYNHMSIYPYPSHLVDRWQLADGTNMVIRPIRPEDARIEDEFVRNLSPQSKYYRFMQALHELTPKMLVRFTQIDYYREMALIATTQVDEETKQVAVGRYVTNPDAMSCEFAIVVGDDWRNRGIASRIMMSLIQVAKSRGLQRMEGEILSENKDMLSLVRKLGFSLRPCEDDPGVQLAEKLL